MQKTKKLQTICTKRLKAKERSSLKITLQKACNCYNKNVRQVTTKMSNSTEDESQWAEDQPKQSALPEAQHL